MMIRMTCVKNLHRPFARGGGLFDSCCCGQAELVADYCKHDGKKKKREHFKRTHPELSFDHHDRLNE
jgi:hypothetical protein